MANQIIYYFDEPTIGYCSGCDEFAVYDIVRGLHCPKCESTDLSIFKYTGEGPHPK